MERVEDLINKLYHQQKQNQSTSTLLATVQQLYAELLKQQPSDQVVSPKKISVVMPAAAFQKPAAEIFPSGPEGEEKPVEKIVAEEPAPAPKPADAYTLKKPVVESKPQVTAIPGQLPFDAMAEVPTLSQQLPPKELHEVIANKKESLNDKLKPEHKEVAHSLKDTAIKDLRKGIAVNDKFVFINELFRGDEAMYERSIKTINAFTIFQEAEYWINRELNVKLGWNDDNEVVKHFYEVVRRRFL
jgi:hypothetical protein